MAQKHFDYERFRSIPIQVAFKELVDKVNELVDEINELDIQLSRVRKDRPDPRSVSPYDLSGVRKKTRKR